MIIAGFIIAMMSAYFIIDGVIGVSSETEFSNTIELILNYLYGVLFFAPLILCGWGLRHRSQQPRRVRILGYWGAVLPFIPLFGIVFYAMFEFGRHSRFGP